MVASNKKLRAGDNQVFKQAETAADDYEENMFADGNNRAETDEQVKKAPEYNCAAHKIDNTSDPMSVTAPVKNPINNASPGNIGMNEGFARGTKDADRTRPVDMDPQEANDRHAS